jgi:hypothetical protein
MAVSASAPFPDVNVTRRTVATAVERSAARHWIPSRDVA